MSLPLEEGPQWHPLWVAPVLLSQLDKAWHQKLNSVEVQGFLSCIINKTQKQWLSGDNREKVIYEEHKWEQATSRNKFKVYCTFSMRLDYCWEAPGSVQVSSLKTSTNANSPWKCLSQKRMSVYLQVFVTEKWKLPGLFPNTCPSLTRAFIERLILW